MDKKRKPVIAGEQAPESCVYKCSKCGAFTSMLETEKAQTCDFCAISGNEQVWIPTSKKIIQVAKDVNKEFEKRTTWQQRFSDIMTAFCGNMGFVYLHMVWFGFWIFANENWIPGVPVFDPFPYGLLTMIVSLEAIILATFILISQNRASARSELRSEYDYQIDMKAEKNIAEILAILREMHPKKRKK